MKNIDENNKNAEMAISLRSRFQGSGLAEKAFIELIEIAKDELDLHKLYLNVLSENVRAKKFYEKMGFVLTGKSKEHIYKDGCYRDLDWYECIIEG